MLNAKLLVDGSIVLVDRFCVDGLTTILARHVFEQDGSDVLPHYAGPLPASEVFDYLGLAAE
jgi:hypothetical protein